MERDLFSIELLCKLEFISTHTLTWSVTLSTLSLDVEKDFNSHAHVERDRRLAYGKHEQDHFNSHAHVERDLCNLM